MFSQLIFSSLTAPFFLLTLPHSIHLHLLLPLPLSSIPVSCASPPHPLSHLKNKTVLQNLHFYNIASGHPDFTHLLCIVSGSNPHLLFSSLANDNHNEITWLLYLWKWKMSTSVGCKAEVRNLHNWMMSFGEKQIKNNNMNNLYYYGWSGWVCVCVCCIH